MQHRPTVLVLWTGYPAGYRAVRSLRRAGFRVVGAAPEGRAGARSAGCLRPRRYPAPTRSPERFLAFVTETCRRERVDAVLPMDEDIVRLLARRAPDLAGAVLVGPDARAYDLLCDKLGLAATARALGLDTPETIEVGPGGPSGPWPPLPSVIKPKTSGTDVLPAEVVRTAAERDALVAALLAAGSGAVVQEMVTGPRTVLHCVRGERVWEVVAHRVTLEWPRGCGLASEKRVADPDPAMVHAARTLLDHVDYRGACGISFLTRDGRHHPHDANLRLGATTGASVNCGLDFPRRAVEAALGREGEPFDGRPRPGRYLRLDLELPALRHEWRTRRAGGRPGAALRRILEVGLSRDGMLDPSPVNPFWVGGMLARAAGRLRRPGGRPAAAETSPASPAPAPAGSLITTPTH
jgi:hypothetical protein